MHGIPVLFKDNITTGDQMHTTAGAAVLKDWRGDRDDIAGSIPSLSAIASSQNHSFYGYWTLD